MPQSTDTTDKSYICFIQNLCVEFVFLIHFVWNLYVMCHVYVRLMSGDVICGSTVAQW